MTQIALNDFGAARSPRQIRRSAAKPYESSVLVSSWISPFDYEDEDDDETKRFAQYADNFDDCSAEEPAASVWDAPWRIETPVRRAAVPEIRV